jgi:hypothetical protein
MILDGHFRGRKFVASRLKITLMVVIVLLGAFFRLYHIRTIPPGDGFDPAYYGLDALRILNGERPVYLATNFGREVMFSYLVAGVYAVVGPGTFGIHLASALVSILTIPVVFLAAAEFFKRETGVLVRRYGGLLAALITAVSFWHLAWSRYSVRAILIPFFVSLLGFCLLRALRLQQRRYFFWTGVVMGLSFYTYQLAQLFPLLVSLGFLYNVISRRSVTKKDVSHIVILFGTAFLLAIPLLYFIYNNPGVFNQRINGVFVLKDTNVLSEQIGILGESIWRMMQMYIVKGDDDPLINLPGRPLLNPFLAAAFITGLLIALYRWRRPHYLFLLSWVAVMSAPAFLATKAAMSKRALGALPAASLLIALALLTLMDKLRSRHPRFDKRMMLSGLTVIILGLVYAGGITFRDYFITWAEDPALVYHYNAGVAEVGEYAAGLPASERVYLSPTWIDHSVLKLHSGNREGIRGYNGRHCFLYPQETVADTTYIIVPGDDHNSLSLVQRYFPQGQLRHQGYLSNGDSYFTAYQIPDSSLAQFQPEQPVIANWDDQVALLGYDIGGSNFKAGDSIRMNLYLRPLADMSRDYTIFIHLIGAENPQSGSLLWGQVDREPCFQSYPTSWWQSEEILRDTFDLPIAPDAPPGVYTLRIGFYWWPDSTRLKVINATNEAVDETVILQEIHIGAITPQ